MRGLLLLLSVLVFAACSGETGPCDSDGDCENGLRCAAVGARPGQCLQAACFTDAECRTNDARTRCDLETYACVLRDGFADECSSAADCTFGTFCSTLLGRCLPTENALDCVRRSQCPSQQICDRQANKCIPDVGCVSNAFCESGEVCDLVQGNCVAISIECNNCFLGQACADGTSCDAATLECLAPGAEAQCEQGERCDPLNRCVQCTNTDECGPGLYCNAALGRCESNVQCAERLAECPASTEVQCTVCTAPEVCDARTRRCQAPAAICTSDVDCPGEQRCDLTLDPPVCVLRVPDCLNDLLDEPANDRFTVARALDVAAGPNYADLKLCPGDVDWYRLDVAAGTYLTIDARFRHADGDLDLQLFLPDATTLVDASRTTNDNERVELEAGTDRTLLLRVFYAVPSITSVGYALNVTRSTGSLCPDDSNESDDGPGEAKAIVSDVSRDGRVCAADPDWYVIENVPAGSQVQAELRFQDNLGDLDLELYRGGEPAPLARATSLDDDERLDYDATFGGAYFLRVFGKGADANLYTLRVEVRPSNSAMCVDDLFESNNAPSTRTATVPPLFRPELTLCRGDEDWFAISLTPGEALTAEIGFLAGADLEMRLYEDEPDVDPRSTPLRASTDIGMREFVAARSQMERDYLLRVHGFRPDQLSPYQLRLEKLPPLSGCSPDMNDIARVGNTSSTAVFINPPPSRYDDASLCFGDTDFYRVFLAAGFINVIRIHYVENDAVLNFALVDGGADLAVTDGVGRDSKQIDARVPGIGFYPAILRVFRSSGFGATEYSVTMDLLPILDCVPDLQEPNNQLQLASTVTASAGSSFEIRDLTLCASEGPPGDEDWFQLAPNPGDRIEASIEFSQSDLFLELIGPNGVARACNNGPAGTCYSDGSDFDEAISFTATTSAYWLRVGSIYSSPEVPTIPPDADTSYVLRLNYLAP